MLTISFITGPIYQSVDTPNYNVIYIKVKHPVLYLFDITVLTG